ncbi:2-dehydro-3-deoxy-D-gluconate 5-dehydrogenase KduD [Rubrivirga marina]|uniref:2-deoxy-D-gluconate 3-dehydrogenase n=1 Tax=Rubrivirga marina TaxID=1196024 RepID=A0A271IVX2_9BACT|nr:2-dehydro-3-deoxy-D-gluconate 5-dehydrogenase KduD [Rubrivirga marina]PAP75396.1 2-deoxy-D-gluconate 3-dehydrogenase [Rubrivirga marina]
MSSPFSLEDKRALVTGASRGIGQGIAVALAEAGADVVCASTRRAGTDETAEAVRQRGRRAWQLEADLSDREAAAALAEAAEAEAGPIDILVNNAGTIRRHPAVDFPMADWEFVLRTNLDATFVLCQAVGRGMVERGRGKIVNVASLLSFQGGVTVPAYTASKHAVAGLTKALANEWAPSGVTVNAIAPGYIATDNTQALQDNEARSRQILERIPAGRWGDPADLGGAAVFLASPASDYVNGHVLVVDGGWMAR